MFSTGGSILVSLTHQFLQARSGLSAAGAVSCILCYVMIQRLVFQPVHQVKAGLLGHVAEDYSEGLKSLSTQHTMCRTDEDRGSQTLIVFAEKGVTHAYTATTKPVISAVRILYGPTMTLPALSRAESGRTRRRLFAMHMRQHGPPACIKGR